jgi:hypothetical protein
MVEDRTLSKADVRKLRALIDAPERAPRKR